MTLESLVSSWRAKAEEATRLGIIESPLGVAYACASELEPFVRADREMRAYIATAEHSWMCRQYRQEWHDADKPCTCGLFKIRKSLEESNPWHLT